MSKQNVHREYINLKTVCTAAIFFFNVTLVIEAVWQACALIVRAMQCCFLWFFSSTQLLNCGFTFSTDTSYTCPWQTFFFLHGGLRCKQLAEYFLCTTVDGNYTAIPLLSFIHILRWTTQSNTIRVVYICTCVLFNTIIVKFKHLLYSCLFIYNVYFLHNFSFVYIVKGTTTYRTSTCPMWI